MSLTLSNRSATNLRFISIVLNVRAQELACTLEETRETMQLAQDALKKTGPVGTKEKIASALFPRTSKQGKLETKIESELCI